MWSSPRTLIQLQHFIKHLPISNSIWKQNIQQIKLPILYKFCAIHKVLNYFAIYGNSKCIYYSNIKISAIITRINSGLIVYEFLIQALICRFVYMIQFLWKNSQKITQIIRNGNIFHIWSQSTLIYKAYIKFA